MPKPRRVTVQWSKLITICATIIAVPIAILLVRNLFSRGVNTMGSSAPVDERDKQSVETVKSRNQAALTARRDVSEFAAKLRNKDMPLVTRLVAAEELAKIGPEATGAIPDLREVLKRIDYLLSWN